MTGPGKIRGGLTSPARTLAFLGERGKPAERKKF